MFLWFRCSYVHFISEDLNYIAKKVLFVFLVVKYSEVINSSICMYLPLLSLSVNSVQICDSISNLLNSDHHSQSIIAAWTLQAKKCVHFQQLGIFKFPFSYIYSL